MGLDFSLHSKVNKMSVLTNFRCFKVKMAERLTNNIIVLQVLAGREKEYDPR